MKTKFKYPGINMKRVYFLFLISIILSSGCNDSINSPDNTSPQPEILRIVPMKGYPGDAFTITGKNLGTEEFMPIIYLGHKDSNITCEIKSITFRDTMNIQCIVPKDGKTGKIVIETKKGDVESEQNFIVPGTYTPDDTSFIYPGIISISPTTVGEYQLFMIIGKGLGSPENPSQVYFGEPTKNKLLSVDSVFNKGIGDTVKLRCIVRKDLTGSDNIYIKKDTYEIRSNAKLTISTDNNIVTGFYPPSICKEMKFNVKGKGFLKFKQETISVLVGSTPVNIETISDTLITCNLNNINLNYGDYIVAVKVFDRYYSSQERFGADEGYGTVRKLMYGESSIDSVIPSAAQKDSKVRFYCSFIGPNPTLIFGQSKAQLLNFMYAGYYTKLNRQAFAYLYRGSGYIDCIVPADASYPIILKSECGELDISDKFSFLPYTIDSVKITIKNLQSIFSNEIVYDKKIDTTKFSISLPSSATMFAFDRQNQKVFFYDSSYKTTGSLIGDELISRIGYEFNLGAKAAGKFEYKYSKYQSPSNSATNNDLKISGEFINMNKTVENNSIIEYKLVGNEINSFLSNFYYYEYSRRIIGGVPYSKKEFIDFLQQTDSSEFVMTIYKK